jgi:ABC-2 type transport system permease protein
VPTFRRTLRTLRWQVFGYGVGLVAWAVLIVALFPTMGESYGQLQLPDVYRDMFGLGAGSLGEFRSFASLEFYQWVPIVLAIYVITVATGTLAGEEGRGSLEILLAQPVSRRRLFLEKVAAIGLGALMIAALTAVALVMSVSFIDTGGDLTAFQLGAAVFGTLPVVALAGSLALLLATVAPSRGTAAALVAAVFVAAWLVNGLGALSPQTQWLQPLSGFYYADLQTLLTDGLTPWHQAVVLGVTVLQTVLALIAFERRDIEVSRWQARALLPGAR